VRTDRPPIPPSVADVAPARGTVFGEILLRSTVLATAGGAVIGLLGVPVTLLIRTGTSDFAD
jgi:hypothetical protein